jgi:acetyl-CoA carboxylase carboxyl transferase subunit beta
MARSQHVRAQDLLARGVVDRIIAEHPDAADEPEAFCVRVGEVLRYELAQLRRQDPARLAATRPERFAAREVSLGPQ